MNKIWIFTACSVLFLFSSQIYAADIEAGKALVKARCQYCHGMDGISGSPAVPNHRGQQRIYFARQLEDFKSGKRKSDMMSVQAEQLSKDDINNVAAYYSSLPCN